MAEDGAALEPPPTAAPEVAPRRPRLGWRRQILPGAGLALLLTCLVQLLNSASFSFSGWLGSGRFAPKGAAAVVLDPGHGGADSGAVAQGVVEKDLNLDVALRLAADLEGRGITVRLTREDDRFIPLAGRVSIANALPDAIFVSIHFNDSPGAGRQAALASGIETYYSDTRALPPASRWMWASLTGAPADDARNQECVRDSQRLADSIQGALVSGTAAADRGIKERALYVTRRVLAPAVLVEGGFVSHPEEARRLGEPAYRQRLADFIAAGIAKYLASTPHRATTTTVATR